MWFGNYCDASRIVMTIKRASTLSTKSSPASDAEGVQWIVKQHFVIGGRQQESIVFALSMIRRHGQTARRMTMLFAMFYDEFLGNMETRRTW
jgi:hypothetical protein